MTKMDIKDLKNALYEGIVIFEFVMLQFTYGILLPNKFFWQWEIPKYLLLYLELRFVPN